MNKEAAGSTAALSGHISIAITLVALTGLNVYIHSLGLEPEQSTRLVLFVAAIQAFLILEFLMHLIDGERATIGLVFFSLVFVGALFFLSYLTFHDSYGEHTALAAPAAVTTPAAAEH